MDLFKDLTVHEYVKKTYISKGSTRDYKQFCEDLIHEIGGQENYVSCTRCAFPFLSPVKGTPYIMKVKDISKANTVSRLICSECYIHNDGDHIQITATGLMEELIDALCKIKNG